MLKGQLLIYHVNIGTGTPRTNALINGKEPNKNYAKCLSVLAQTDCFPSWAVDAGEMCPLAKVSGKAMSPVTPADLSGDVSRYAFQGPHH